MWDVVLIFCKIINLHSTPPPSRAPGRQYAVNLSRTQLSYTLILYLYFYFCYFLFLTLKSNPKDLWLLSHLIRLMRRHDIYDICEYLWIFLNICEYLCYLWYFWYLWIFVVNICEYLCCEYLWIFVNICEFLWILENILSIYMNICEFLTMLPNFDNFNFLLTSFLPLQWFLLPILILEICDIW